ncbi:ArsR/SmtB family transcription factor [Plantactinospora sp. GCM10030261]|uniref:ArsR/SmtB family transcription factor n=1 Tax=Plantactinospora sp. GCM10030261 TaxID=3273420 RepID=UPI003671BCF7
MDDLRVDVKIMPMASVLSLLADAAGRPQGVPPLLRSAVRSNLPYEATRLLTPMFGPSASSIPHCLTPSVSVRDVDFESHLNQIATAAHERLPDQVTALYGEATPGHWDWALRRPGRWVDAYIAMLRSAWEVLRPHWQRAQPLLEREIVRVGTASVRDTFDGVLAHINPRWHYRDESLLIPDRHPERFALDNRRLVLTPTVSGVGASVFDPDMADMLWLGYPLPNLWTVWRSEPAGCGQDPLVLVLGPMRASLLRHAGSGLGMSQLADLLHCAPSVVTYHCTSLVDAGLLYRERRGRHTHVRRTERGNAMLDLLAGG